MLAAATSEGEKSGAHRGLQREGVPMVGDVRLHGFAARLAQDSLPGGDPF